MVKRGRTSWTVSEEMNQKAIKKRPWLSPVVTVIVLCYFCSLIEHLEGACEPWNGCSTALAYYRVRGGENLTQLAERFQTTLEAVSFYNSVNEGDSISTGQGLRFPFPCECVNEELEYNFAYEALENDTVQSIVDRFGGLSQQKQIEQTNNVNSSVYAGQNLQIPVRCFCGMQSMAAFGLFTTYISVPNDNLSSVAETSNTCTTLIQLFNPSVNFSGQLLAGQTLFIPSTNGTNGPYLPFQSSDGGGSSALIALVSVFGAVTLVLFILVLWLSYSLFLRKREAKKVDDQGFERGLVSFSGPSPVRKFKEALLSGRSGTPWFARESRSLHSGPLRSASGSVLSPSGPVRSGLLGSGPLTSSGAPARSLLLGFGLDRSVEFSFEELAAATNNFNVANKIGEGGYGNVYVATLRGQVTAVKRMNVQATREFLSELQILSHVHHTHLVQLIGYCTVDSLFLIYEFVENGPLEKHLQRRNGLPPLSWPARVQIALDAARGLEYIHEHTKPSYIHRDVKSNNILLDKRLRAKVADFGLTKLTDTGFSSVSISMSTPMRLVGTFGYMPPEYAKYGDVSPKVDVYSFGVVLFEIISGKSAIVKTLGHSGNPKIPLEDQRSLVEMFEEVLRHPRGPEALRGLVDPALEQNFSLESAWKMAQLASDCTKDNPELRPDMRSVVVSLMALSSTMTPWEKIRTDRCDV